MNLRGIILAWGLSAGGLMYASEPDTESVQKIAGDRSVVERNLSIPALRDLLAFLVSLK